MKNTAFRKVPFFRRISLYDISCFFGHIRVMRTYLKKVLRKSLRITSQEFRARASPYKDNGSCLHWQTFYSTGSLSRIFSRLWYVGSQFGRSMTTLVLPSLPRASACSSSMEEPSSESSPAVNRSWIAEPALAGKETSIIQIKRQQANSVTTKNVFWNLKNFSRLKEKTTRPMHTETKITHEI